MGSFFPFSLSFLVVFEFSFVSQHMFIGLLAKVGLYIATGQAGLASKAVLNDALSTKPY